MHYNVTRHAHAAREPRNVSPKKRDDTSPAYPRRYLPHSRHKNIATAHTTRPNKIPAPPESGGRATNGHITRIWHGSAGQECPRGWAGVSAGSAHPAGCGGRSPGPARRSRRSILSLKAAQPEGEMPPAWQQPQPSEATVSELSPRPHMRSDFQPPTQGI